MYLYIITYYDEYKELQECRIKAPSASFVKNWFAKNYEDCTLVCVRYVEPVFQ